MHPIEFPEATIVLAKNQPQYQPLPIHRTKDGYVTSCWRLSFGERMRLLFTGKLWLSMMTFNNPPMPILPSVDWTPEE